MELIPVVVFIKIKTNGKKFAIVGRVAVNPEQVRINPYHFGKIVFHTEIIKRKRPPAKLQEGYKHFLTGLHFQFAPYSAHSLFGTIIVDIILIGNILQGCVLVVNIRQRDFRAFVAKIGFTALRHKFFASAFI